MKKAEIIIIGAGPAGLGAGIRLQDLGYSDFIILEQNPYPGGLSASFKTKEGYIFDLGGHVFFSRDSYFKEIAFNLLKDEVHFRTRNASIYLDKQIIPYPFQDNISALAPEIQWEIAKDFLEITFRRKENPSSIDSHFLNWLKIKFGNTISQLFMIPYNKKVWACDLKKMGTYWIKDRVSTLRLEHILERIILGKKRQDWGPNAEFFYPDLGTGYLFEKMARRLDSHILYNNRVKAIDLKRKTIITGENNEIKYKNLISSMPIRKIFKCFEPNHPRIKKLIQMTELLKYNSGYILGLGLDFNIEIDNHWVYFPEKAFPWFRLTVISNYSPSLTPAGKSALMFDTSFNPYRGLKIGSKDIIPLLRKITFLPTIKESNIISVFEKTLPFFYPIPTIHRDKYLAAAFNFLEKNQILPIGRFGKWRYEEGNMDHAFLHGKEAADTALSFNKKENR